MEDRNIQGEEILNEINAERNRLIGQLQEWFSSNDIPAEERKSKLEMVSLIYICIYILKIQTIIYTIFD